MPLPKTAAEPQAVPKTAAELAIERRQAEDRAADLEALGSWLAVARSEAGELIAGGERQAFLIEQLSDRVNRHGYEAKLIACADRVRADLLRCATWYAGRYPRTVPHVHEDRGQTFADILPGYAWDCLRQGRLDFALSRGAQAGYLRPYPARLASYFEKPRPKPGEQTQRAGSNQAEAEAAWDAQGRGF